MLNPTHSLIPFLGTEGKGRIKGKKKGGYRMGVGTGPDKGGLGNMVAPSHHWLAMCLCSPKS